MFPADPSPGAVPVRLLVCWTTLSQVAVAAAASGILSCSNNVDDLFCDPVCPEEEQPSSREQEEDKALTHGVLLTAPDLDTRPDCERCALEACEAERAICLTDEQCAPKLAPDAVPCDNPSCAEKAAAEAGLEGLSATSQKLAACAFRECPDECRMGGNLGCLHDFTWNNANADSVEVYMRFAVGQRWDGGPTAGNKLDLGGAMVAACTSTDECGDALSLDAASAATVTLPTEDGRFRGFFEIRGQKVGPVPPRYRIYMPPLSRSQQVWVDVHPDLELIQDYQWLPSLYTAALWATATDCTGNNAARVRFELAEYTDASVWHLGGTELSEANTESTSGVAFFPELNLEEESEWVTLRAWVGSELLSEQRIQLRRGWRTQVRLAPSSISGE